MAICTNASLLKLISVPLCGAFREHRYSPYVESNESIMNSSVLGLSSQKVAGLKTQDRTGRRLE